MTMTDMQRVIIRRALGAQADALTVQVVAAVEMGNLHKAQYCAEALRETQAVLAWVREQEPKA